MSEASEIVAWTSIAVASVGAIATLIGVFVRAYTDYLIKKLEIKDKEKKEVIQQNNQKALVHDIESTSVLKQILSDIQKEINCDRLNVWMFHNGGYFYTGESIQRMTMIAEMTHAPLEPIKHKFTGIPIRVFARNLEKLISSSYTHERNELAYNDALAAVNQEYKITSSAIFKLMSADNKDWVGTLAIGWTNHQELTQDQINYIAKQTEIISQILTPDYLNI